MAAGGKRFPDVNAVRQHDDFHLRGEALHPFRGDSQIWMGGQNYERFFSGGGQGCENESPFRSTEAANRDVGIGDGIFMRAGRVIESEGI